MAGGPLCRTTPYQGGDGPLLFGGNISVVKFPGLGSLGNFGGKFSETFENYEKFGNLRKMIK